MLNCKDKIEIIIGNAGCGKTTELIRRVSKLLEDGVKPSKIAYCSFSVMAIEEAIKRATEKCQLKRDDFPYFRTIHSFAFQLLGLNVQQIMQDYHMHEFGKIMKMKFISSCSKSAKGSIVTPDDEKLNIVNIARLCDTTVKDYMIENRIDKFNVAEVEELANMYRNYKITKSIFDYTDMLLLAKTAELDIPDLEYLFIDEAQDLSTLQWRIVERLAERSDHIVIAGDDKQSINIFAGADVDYFLNIPGKVTVLEQSYRTPRRVFNMANKIMGKMDKYREEGAVWLPRDVEGSIKYVSGLPWAAMNNGKWLILTRTNSQLQRIKQTLYENCDRITMLFTVNGEPGVDMDIFRAIELFEMKDTPSGITKMDLITLKKTDTAEQRKQKIEYIQLFKKFIGSRVETPNVWEVPEDFIKSFMLDSWLKAFTKLSIPERKYIAYILPHYRKYGKDMYNDVPLRLMTIHTAKGTEEDNVVVLANVPRTVYNEFDNNNDEAKVFYVAVTRTRKNLYILEQTTNKETYKRYIE